MLAEVLEVIDRLSLHHKVVIVELILIVIFAAFVIKFECKCRRSR